MAAEQRTRRVRTALRIARKAIVVGLAVGVLYVMVTFVQVWHASRQHHHQPAAAIVVMGAAQYDGRPSPVLQARLDRALELYRQGLAPLLVTTGFKREGDRFTEGFAGKQYLSSLGVPDEDIANVDIGTNTWEELSAASDELHRRAARQPADQTRVRVLIVSDSYHSLRLEHTAREVGLDPLVAPTGPRASTRRLVRETVAVSLGRVLGYRRLAELTS
ncbi:MAG TPA: YdcF family protein [Acidimicrobiales bacterium]|nr:YdcF family protein [Acidimicrobiales bacterium]